MVARVNALWSHSRLIKSIVIVLSAVNTLVFAICGSYGWATAKVIPQIPPFTGCAAIPRPDLNLSMIFIPAIIFETCVVVLIFIKAYPMLNQTRGRLPLFTLLLSDGIMYYIVIIIAQAFAFSTSFSGNYALLLPVAASSPSIIASAIACNRLFIRLQDVLKGGQVIVFEVTKGDGISGRMCTDERAGETNGEVGFPPVAYDERARQIRRPTSTNWSDV
jgi:hypothetical protein